MDSALVFSSEAPTINWRCFLTFVDVASQYLLSLLRRDFNFVFQIFIITKAKTFNDSSSYFVQIIVSISFIVQTSWKVRGSLRKRARGVKYSFGISTRPVTPCWVTSTWSFRSCLPNRPYPSPLSHGASESVILFNETTISTVPAAFRYFERAFNYRSSPVSSSMKRNIFLPPCRGCRQFLRSSA